MNDVEFAKLMNTLDVDGDGMISYEEFMAKIGSEISFEGPLRRANGQMGGSGRSAVPQAQRAPPPRAISSITFG